MLANTKTSDLIKNGAIIGIVSVIISAALWAIDADLMMKIGQWLDFIIGIALLCYFTIQIRNKEGGFISFGDAFKAIFIMALVGSLIGYIWQIILFEVLDPGMADRVKEVAISAAEKSMEAFGAPEDVMDKELAKMEEQDFSPLGGRMMLQYLGMAVLGNAILAAILAAILKRKEPVQF